MRFIAGHQLPALHQALRRQDNIRLCACGCGESVNPRNPVARFVRGHHPGVGRPRIRLPHPCECGCGEIAKPYARFVGHHGNRGVKRGPGRYVNNFGYVMLRMPDHPQARKGYVSEHRWVMEQKIRRPLTSSEAVHHLNHQKADNRPENLLLLTRAEHGHHHGRPVGRPVTAEHRRKLSEQMKRVWAERKAAP